LAENDVYAKKFPKLSFTQMKIRALAKERVIPCDSVVIQL